MKRYDFYYKRLVTENDLDQAWDAAEKADQDIVADLGLNGVVKGAGVEQVSPTPNLSVSVSSGTVYDTEGRRIRVASTQLVNMATDENGVATIPAPGSGFVRYLSLFIKFNRTLSDPKLDGNNTTVFFQRDESFEFNVVAGVQNTDPAVQQTARPALRPGEVLLADILVSAGQNQIINANIDVSRRQDLINYSGASVDFRGLAINEALVAMGTSLDTYTARLDGIEDEVDLLTDVRTDLDAHIAPTGPAAHADNKISTTASSGFPIPLTSVTVADKFEEVQDKVNASLVRERFSKWDRFTLSNTTVSLGNQYAPPKLLPGQNGALFTDVDGSIAAFGSGSYVHKIRVFNDEMDGISVACTGQSPSYTAFGADVGGSATVYQYARPITSISTFASTTIPTSMIVGDSPTDKSTHLVEWSQLLNRWIACISGLNGANPAFELWTNTSAQPATGTWVRQYNANISSKATGTASSTTTQLVVFNDGSILTSPNGTAWTRTTDPAYNSFGGCVWHAGTQRFYAPASAAGSLRLASFTLNGNASTVVNLNEAVAYSTFSADIAVDDILGGGVMVALNVPHTGSSEVYELGQVRTYYYRGGKNPLVDPPEINVVADGAGNGLSTGDLTVVEGSLTYDSVYGRYMFALLSVVSLVGSDSVIQVDALMSKSLTSV